MTNKQILERLESKVESLYLSLDRSKVNTILRLEIYPRETYAYDRQVFMESINKYQHHFDIPEWEYMIEIGNKDNITMDEIYHVIDIFKKVRETIEFLG